MLGGVREEHLVQDPPEAEAWSGEIVADLNLYDLFEFSTEAKDSPGFGHVDFGD